MEVVKIFGKQKKKESKYLLCIDCGMTGREGDFYKREQPMLADEYTCPNCKSEEVYPQAVAVVRYVKRQIQEENGPVPPMGG